jgi:superfamily II DNA/RNA helicase
LLPKTGVNPLEMMQQFKNNETTVMLATPNSVRGLDFPDVTHVYTLYLPTEDPREYIHLAGRVGRVGQRGSVRGSGGRVVSILQEQDADKMDAMAKELGFEFTDTSSAAVDDDISRIISRITTIDDDDDDDEDGDDIDIVADKSDFTNPDDLDKVRRYLEDTVSLLTADGDEEVKEGGPTDVEFQNDDSSVDDEDDSFQ